jgi:glycine oxidase
VKFWDVIIVGGGIIGLSLAISLRKQGLRVLIVERGEPGREASSAAAGMLVGNGNDIPADLRPLAEASAKMYPEFVHELEDESGTHVDLREQGTILLSGKGQFPDAAEPVSAEQLRGLEPAVSSPGRGRLGLRDHEEISGAFLRERSLDPRALAAAAVKAAHHRGVDISSGNEVRKLISENSRAAGVETTRGAYFAPTVVNCAGAWAGCVEPHKFPVRPVKGQMLAIVGGPPLKHVIRAEEVYLVPRSDGRIVIGSTLEEAGYNKQTEVSTIQRLFKAAVEVVPSLAESKIHEDWAGLRPGTADDLPILGETSTPGYFVAAGHYRDGILLAPITAQVMTDVILQKTPSQDLTAFSPARFAELNH